MRVLPRVEVKVLHRRFFARPDDRNIEAHRKAGFEVDAASNTSRFACKVGHQKPRTADFGDDFVVYFIEVVVLLVNTPRGKFGRALPPKPKSG
jgi:hypothetical protein